MPRSLAQRLKGFAAGIYFRLKNGPIAQRENARRSGKVDEATAELLRRTACEGAVLLENDGTLPLHGKFALFGRTQIDTFYSGYGSGGDVSCPYTVSILEGLERAGAPIVSCVSDFYRAYEKEHAVKRGGWGNWAFSYPEPACPEALLVAAAAETDTAVVVFGRAAGEDMDSELSAGSFLLTEAERSLYAALKRKFARVAVLLNTGGLIDFSLFADDRPNALLMLYQGGMEAGNACTDLLLGRREPRGRLPDTIAKTYRDYPTCDNFFDPDTVRYREDIYIGYRAFETNAPEKVVYPFGYGLGYTEFCIKADYADGVLTYRVRNTGARAGRTVVEVYVRKPPCACGVPARELVAFRKTAEISPGEEERGEISVPIRAFCVYSEAQHAFVRMAGEYEIFAGFDVRSAPSAGKFTADTDQVVEACSDILSCDLRPRILEALPAAYPKQPPVPFEKVQTGEVPLSRFVAGLSEQALEALSRGALKMDSPLGPRGNAGVMGGVTKELQALGVPPVTMVDGPSGIRLFAGASLLPIATLLAATFDEDLVEEVYAAVGREMAELGAHVLLAPALNLHRDPLCGRNFEYYSEDPLLSGKIAAAAVRGVQSVGASACPKHFACNNREFRRNKCDSVLSERALRELYLYGFEICVKESHPHFLMTSYNKVNGVYAHYNYRLVRGVLRGEWKFEGCVVTDWYMQKAASPEFKHIKNNAYRIRAGVNVLMPGGGFLGKKMQHGGVLRSRKQREGLTLGELQQNAEEVLSAVRMSAACRGESNVVR